MPEELPIILVKDVDYTYPNRTVALKHINLNIYKGELDQRAPELAKPEQPVLFLRLLLFEC